jgi:hypothetical protein
MRFLGLEDLAFSDIYDKEKSEEGKKFCRIGINYL